MIEILSIIKEHRLLFSGGAFIGLLMLCYALGVSNGRVPHVVECSEELVKQAKLARERDEATVKLASCEVRDKGAAILENSAECDLRVQRALKDAKSWACDD